MWGVDIRVLIGDKRSLWSTGTGVTVGCEPPNLFLGTEFWSPGKARNIIELYPALQTTQNENVVWKRVPSQRASGYIFAWKWLRHFRHFVPLWAGIAICILEATEIMAARVTHRTEYINSHMVLHPKEDTRQHAGLAWPWDRYFVSQSLGPLSEVHLVYWIRDREMQTQGERQRQRETMTNRYRETEKQR